jgi:hypothetical protein
MKLFMQFLLIITFSHPLSVFAELPDRIKQDFAPVSGVIIMPIGEEYLVDLDATVNLQEGDILTLTAAGEKVIHPTTKEVLGTLDRVRGYLQVTQIKSGYSYAKIITAHTLPRKGDRVKRFEQVPALFKSTVEDTTLESKLKAGLPHLNWLDEKSPELPQLTFALNANELLVQNIDGIVLKTYQYTNRQLSAPITATARHDPFVASATPQPSGKLLDRAVSSVMKTVGLGKKDKRLENPAITRSQIQNPGIWTGPDLGGNPVGLAVGDFDNDGQQEIAIAMEDHLQIHRIVDEQLTPVANIDFGGVHLLSLDMIDLDNNGSVELIASANVETRLNSQVIGYRDGIYQRTMSGIPWLLRVIDLPQEGRTLIAQTLRDHETALGNTPFRVTVTDEEFHKGKILALPEKSNLFSFVPIIGTNNDLLYTYITQSDSLQVSTPKGTGLWESSTYFGGTEEFFYNKKSSKHELTIPIHIQKRLLNLSTGKILVGQNQGSRLFERFRNFKKSSVIAMEWDGIALIESWRTSEQSGYLADYTVADADNDGQVELVMAINFNRKSPIQKGRSAIVIYELNQ